MKKISNKKQKIEDQSLQNAIKHPEINNEAINNIKSQFQNFKSQAIKKFDFMQTFYASYVKSVAEIQALKKRIYQLTENEQKTHTKRAYNSSNKTNEKLLAQQIPIDVILSKPSNQKDKGQNPLESSDKFNCDQKPTQSIKLQTSHQFPANFKQQQTVQQKLVNEKDNSLISFDVKNTSSHFIKIEGNVITKLGGFDYTPAFFDNDFSTVQQYLVTIMLCQIRNKSSCGVKFGIIDSRTKTLLPSSAERNFITFKMNTNHIVTDIEGKQSKKTFSFSNKKCKTPSTKRDRIKQGDIIKMTVNMKQRKLSWAIFSFNQSSRNKAIHILQNEQPEYVNEIDIPESLINIRNKQNKPIQLVPFASIYNVGDKIEFINLKINK